MKERSADGFETELLRARARGETSADASFEQLFREYRGTVTSWLALRVDRAFVDDLAQDVWLVFYARWQRWEFGIEEESSEARPVLSFLFRTCHFVASGHRRLAANRLTEPSEELDRMASTAGASELLRNLDAGRLLERAQRECSSEELDVLHAKLAGLTARDIAGALGITPSVVDHRYRNALGRLRKKPAHPRKDDGARTDG